MDSKIIVDVFMLTNTKNKDYFEVTRDAILSLKSSENIARFQIYLIESNINSEFHEHYIGLGCDLILFNDEFSFSKAMNYALRHGKNRYALLTNNDVKFDKYWFDEIHKNLNLENVAVWSTHDPETNFNIEPDILILEGYKPYTVHSGWCYLIDVEKLGSNRFLSEDFTTWYMDDDFCMRLQNMGLKQVMCKNSIVYHLGGRSNEIREDFNNKIEQDRLTFLDKYKGQIRIHNVQFLNDKTVINFESFSDGEYEFKITGDVNYQTKINMSVGFYYYISVGKSNSIVLESINTLSKFYFQRYIDLDITISYISHDSKVYEKFLGRSLKELIGRYQLNSKVSGEPPAKLYNDMISECKTKYIIFTHEDVDFSNDLLYKIHETILSIGDFGVIGMVGVDHEGNYRWSTNNKTFEVQTLDSCFIIINTQHDLIFDDQTFDGLHLYVEDYCATVSKKLGKKNYTILIDSEESPNISSKISYLNHHSNTLNKLGPCWGDYLTYKEKLINKWKDIKTT